MRILEVAFGCSDLDIAEEFYGSLLGMRTVRARSSLTVEAGWTTIVLTAGRIQHGAQHLAFTIPRNRFRDAKTWLTDRVPLLRTDDGDEFECAEAWNARSLYFEGPDGVILELIVRRQLSNDSAQPFSGADILGVSEVGVPVSNVTQFVDAAAVQLGLRPYHQGGPSFQPIGDTDGLLILVQEGRTWFPTQSRADLQPLSVTIDSGIQAEIAANASCMIRSH
ncbi:VOC family protein [Leifsonia aquatica]|uniref:VOC family protein n=1 Tax=Leifsonia aquatica TaxID=144185 RepID=UPI00385004B3